MGEPDRIRLLIVDDHKVVRNGLKIFISLYEDIELVGEAKNGQQALDLCRQVAPDVVLMDLVMPVMDGPTAIQHIRSRYPTIQVIALTSFDEETLVRRALEAGAIGYLYKDVDEEALVGAIRAAREERSVLAPAAMRALMKQNTASTEEIPGGSLTTREQEILALVATGMTNPQIAEKLVISPSTVNYHVHNILGKLRVATRTEAVALAIQRKLIDA